jgi:uncharacterized membrane protein
MNSRIAIVLARVMIVGTVVAAAIMAAGLVWYLSAHAGEPVGDHIFKGEPKYLENPVGMVRRAFDPESTGHRRSLVMIGLFLLLINPSVRVALAGIGFLAARNRLYAVISAIVLAVLLSSFFW